MKKDLHPLVILAAGVALGAGTGSILAISFPTVGKVWYWCGGGAVVGGVLFGGAIVASWLYRRVPEIRAATRTAFLWGTAIGGFLSLANCLVSGATGAKPSHATPRQDAFAVGVLFAVGGFLVGCALAAGRVFLRRKRDAGPIDRTSASEPVDGE